MYVCMYVRTYARTHVHCENRFLIQSLALMRSATSRAHNAKHCSLFFRRSISFYGGLIYLLFLLLSRQPSAAFSTCLCTWLHKYVRREGPAALPSLSSGGDLKLTFLSKLTFPSMTDMYACTYVRTHARTYACTQVRTHVHCENRSLIQSLALMRSATSCAHNTKHCSCRKGNYKSFN